MRVEIEKIMPYIESEFIKEALENFAKEGRTFALPQYTQQDRSLIEHRLADLLGGFPYTNDAYPWPTGGAERLHMQPIIQINLENASKLLNFDFGKGLLQVWGLVGASAKSFDVIELAFDCDFNKCILTRIIPMDEINGAPSEFYPEFAPWLLSKEDAQAKDGLLFIEPSKEMLNGSLINWRTSEELMYPIPIYEMHDVRQLVSNFIETDEDIDYYCIFEELKASVTAHLKTPYDFRKCYLGGVRGYDYDKCADPAQGYPVLVAISDKINLSVIFDENLFVKPDRSDRKDCELIHFAREKKLRAVYRWND